MLGYAAVSSSRTAVMASCLGAGKGSDVCSKDWSASSQDRLEVRKMMAGVSDFRRRTETRWTG